MGSKKFLVIGDGNAGATAAQTLREKNEDAEITILTDDSEPLYNRIMLKNYMKGTLPKQYSRVHDRDWYESRDIDLNLETRATDVDTEEKKVETDSGDTYSYDKLLVATGGSPKKLPFDEGYDNLNYMWSMDSAEKIKDSAEDSEKAVVIGGGLLGIDLALAYAEHGAETYYLIRGSNWWRRGLEHEGAEIIHERLQDKGVNVLTETEATEFISKDNSITEVVLKSGDTIKCDSVAAAIGQEANSEFLDVDKNDQGMIKTDEYLRTSAEDVYAAGNMVEYYSPVFERRIVNGSWDHSEEMGKTAANNMLGKEEIFNYVNTYGVGHFDVQFLAIGDWQGDPIEIKYNEDEYRRLFFDEDKLVGAVMIGYTKGQEKVKKLISQKKKLQNKERLLEKDFWE